MKNYSSNISDEALVDIEYIFQFGIETFGLIQTQNYLKDLYLAVDKIAQMPTRGHNHSQLPSQFLVYNLDSHMLIYIINESQKSIEILRIVHKKVDLSGIV